VQLEVALTPADSSTPTVVTRTNLRHLCAATLLSEHAAPVRSPAVAAPDASPFSCSASVSWAA
jgi:hypothetical protein